MSEYFGMILALAEVGRNIRSVAGDNASVVLTEHYYMNELKRRTFL